MPRSIILLLAAMAATPAAALPADPLRSPMWDFVGERIFGPDAVVRFDPRVKVVFPQIAENQRVFPVTVDARGIEGVKRMIVMIDLNPIQQAVDYRPEAAEPYLSLRVKLDQRTPVRGAVQLADGSWLVGGGWIDAAGGGCSAPPVSRVKGDWAQHLGEVRGEQWQAAQGNTLRLAFRHPMDTGFVDNIPAYFLERFAITAADGSRVGTLDLQAAVSEDPVFTLRPTTSGKTLTVEGRDTNGVEYRATVASAKG
ncbi:quinoprotein dehydrogenase-associated SoxYZ-like carrier [Sphingomonas kaistensis]|uniref:Quinoprotein dehydrogenase-associated SoxYZ-like carrier n=1 Tax=Sphingomonas kaistensis TaxID=298708 RepID=A0ABZ2G3X1_9SPHN